MELASVITSGVSVLIAILALIWAVIEHFARRKIETQFADFKARETAATETIAAATVRRSEPWSEVIRVRDRLFRIANKGDHVAVIDFVSVEPAVVSGLFRRLEAAPGRYRNGESFDFLQISAMGTSPQVAITWHWEDETLLRESVRKL